MTDAASYAVIWGNVVRALHRGQAKTVTYVETMAKCIAQSPQVAVMLGMATNEEPASGSYVGNDTNKEPASSSYVGNDTNEESASGSYVGNDTNKGPVSGNYVGNDTNKGPASSSNSVGVAIPQPRVAGEDRYPG